MENLKLSAEKMGITNTLKWFKDYNKKKNAHKVKFGFLYYCPKVLETQLQSADVNPIENLWSKLEHRVYKTPISFLSVLKERLQEELNKKMPKKFYNITADGNPR
ncbi:hypothetical protein ACLKA7_011531 [Drosophila subpalustris]